MKSPKGVIAVKSMEQEKKREALVQNLRDAGCGQDTIEKYCQCCDCGDQRGKERLLEQQRRDLLDDMHRAQKRIDCLDYLWYQERKKAGAEGSGLRKIVR